MLKILSCSQKAMTGTTFAAHRGFKACFPENTMPAFQAAVEAGCSVIETDVHITSDNKVVIAHDVDTTRVFGEAYNICKTPWEGKLDTLLTLREPRSPMPLMENLLSWVCGVYDDGGSVKLMLDIKLDNDPQQLYDLLWKLFEEIRGLDYWKDKIIWGLWRPSYILPQLKGWEVINIAFDIQAAIGFHKVCLERNVTLSAVSMFHMIIYNRNEGKELLKFAEEQNLKIWYWTINKRNEIIKAENFTGALLAGIITDDPIEAMSKQETLVNSFNLGYVVSWWFKKQFYWLFLTLSRRNFNLSPIFRVLQKIGFV